MIKVTCKEVSRLASLEQDGELGAFARLRVLLHLRICESCRNFRKQLDFLRSAVSKLGNPDDR